MADRVGQFLGNYQLLRLLGRGAFAEVYLAEHRYLEIPAAIKVLHVRMEPDTQEHFLREARTIAHLQLTLSAPVPAPAAGASDLTVGATQPLLKVPERTGSEHERLPLLTPRPAAHSHPAPKNGKPSVGQTNRERLLRKVRAFWITGVLEHSLHGAALIALELDQQPEAVANPWQLVLHHPAGAPHPLPAGTRITQVYDAAEGELLILGAPGSGKTTLLLELARDLLARAEHDEQHPLPVVFNLSSWAMKQQPLADWLVEELNSKYQVPRTLGQAWVEADQILPLLDGLDDVSPKDRTACIETINTYRQEHGLLPLVVCSRSADYLAQSARVRLGSAVAVQPLTQQQVDDYLASGGEPLWALRMALHQDAALRELTSTPLMLSLLTLTYHGMPVEDLLRGASVTDRQQQIFAHYVERMLRHRETEMHYTPKQTTQWLSWLARQMKQHNQTVFYIEHLQPNWLSGERMRQAYDRWAVRLPAILMGMLVSVISSPVGVFFFLVLDIVLGGFIGWLLSAGRTTQQSRGSSGKARRGSWSRLVARLRVGVLIGLGAGLSPGLSFGLRAGLSFGLGVGLGSILLQAVLEKRNTTAPRFQAPPLSRKPKWQYLMKSTGTRNGILVGLLLGLSAGLSEGLSAGLISELNAGLSFWLGYRLSEGLIAGPLARLFVGLFVGLLVGLSAGLMIPCSSNKERGNPHRCYVIVLRWHKRQIGGPRRLNTEEIEGQISGLCFEAQFCIFQLHEAQHEREHSSRAKAPHRRRAERTPAPYSSSSWPESIL